MIFLTFWKEIIFSIFWWVFEINLDIFRLETDTSKVIYVEDLDLSHIGTLIVPNSAFVQYIALKRLNLANASIQSIDEHWFNTENKLLDLDLSHNELTGLQRAQFRNLKQLRLLNLMDNNIETIEANTFQDLTQLTHLNLRFNRIQMLAALGHLNRLQQLDMGENSITEVSRIDFLANFMFSSNKIKISLSLQISNNVLQSMGSLTQLQLDQNGISVIRDGTFNGLDNLRELNISGNSIQQLSANTFPLVRLESLDLSNNDLTKVKGQTFRELQSLVTLNLSRNALNELDDQTFVGLVKLKTLLLKDNRILNVQANTFAHLPSIIRIDLSSNALRTLNGNIFGYQILPLQKLFLQKNNIATVQPRTFVAVPYIDFLSLGHNQLVTLDDGIFESLLKLRKLHLHDNKIEFIPQKAFEDMSRLHELQIRHNRLTFLPHTQYPFNNLEKVTLEGNPWQCACLREIFDFITQQLPHRRIEYGSENNPFYMGAKPLCYEAPVNPPAPCVRNADLVRQYRVVELYENALRA